MDERHADEHGEGTAHRRRARTKPAERETPTEVEASVAPQPAEDQPRPAPRQTKRERDAERGLRALTGSGPTQLPVGAAMRARDASRPTEADLRRAEKKVVIVRRNYTPPEPLS